MRYNRGILLASQGGQDGGSLDAAEADLREAIRLLEPLASAPAPTGAQDLARAYNNLGNVVALGEGRIAEVRDLYSRAVHIHEQLTQREPDNREFAMEELQRDKTIVLEITCEVDRGHPAAPELALDRVAVGQGGLEASQGLGQKTCRSVVSLGYTRGR